MSKKKNRFQSSRDKDKPKGKDDSRSKYKPGNKDQSKSKNKRTHGSHSSSRSNSHSTNNSNNHISDKLTEIFPGIFQQNNRLYTISLKPGTVYFKEDTINIKNTEYRQFDPNNSKFATAVKKGLKDTGIKAGSSILYLGSSHGYTVSFLSDVVGKNGIIYAIDPAPRVMRDLVFIAEERKNIAPILADANHPELYADRIAEADLLFQDVAQRNQVDIFLKNLEYLKKDGIAMLALKAKSIDIKKEPRFIFGEAKSKLIAAGLKVEMHFNLDPHQKDHMFFVCKK